MKESLNKFQISKTFQKSTILNIVNSNSNADSTKKSNVAEVEKADPLQNLGHTHPQHAFGSAKRYNIDSY